MFSAKLGAKLAASFGVILLLIVAVGGFSVTKFWQARAAAEMMADNWLTSIYYAGEMRDAMQQEANALAMHIVTKNDSVARKMEGVLEAAERRFDAATKKLQAMHDTGKEKQALQRLLDAHQAYGRERDIILDLRRSDREAEAMARYSGPAHQEFAVFEENIAKLANANYAESVAADDAAERGFYQNRLMIIVAVLIAMLATAGLLYWLRRQITVPIVMLTEQMKRLAQGDTAIAAAYNERADEVGEMARAVVVLRDNAIAATILAEQKQAADHIARDVIATLGDSLGALEKGDLTRFIEKDFPGDYAVLKSSYDAAIGAVRSTIQQVAEAASTLHGGSKEIAQASNDLARRTESNAASIEQASASLVQVNDRIRASADAASSTVARADQAIATVATGRGTADGAVAAMRRVSECAKGIDSVIEGLDKIAFQTRVLAMNAAVEAGRAGEAGRGFAVVADLVSALAMRAEEEAKRAKEQLNVTQTEIGSAVSSVRNVDEALVAIASDVDEVHRLLAGMAADNQAQALAVSEITTAVSSLDKATQENAAMVEEVSAAATGLTNEAIALADSAATFTFERRKQNVPVAVDRRRGKSRTPADPVVRAVVPAPRTSESSIASSTLPVHRIITRAQNAHDAWSEF